MDDVDFPLIDPSTFCQVELQEDNASSNASASVSAMQPKEHTSTNNNFKDPRDVLPMLGKNMSVTFKVGKGDLQIKPVVPNKEQTNRILDNKNQLEILRVSPKEPAPNEESILGTPQNNFHTDFLARNMRKACRTEGKAYVTTTGNVRPARTMQKNPCSGRRCPYNCGKWNDKERILVFNSYWCLRDPIRHRDWIVKHIRKKQVKYRRVNIEDSRRRCRYQYVMERNGHFEVVCKRFFMATLDITDGKIIHAITTHPAFKSKVKQFTTNGIGNMHNAMPNNQIPIGKVNDCVMFPVSCPQPELREDSKARHLLQQQKQELDIRLANKRPALAHSHMTITKDHPANARIPHQIEIHEATSKDKISNAAPRKKSSIGIGNLTIKGPDNRLIDPADLFRTYLQKDAEPTDKQESSSFEIEKNRFLRNGELSIRESADVDACLLDPAALCQVEMDEDNIGRNEQHNSNNKEQSSSAESGKSEASEAEEEMEADVKEQNAELETGKQESNDSSEKQMSNVEDGSKNSSDDANEDEDNAADDDSDAEDSGGMMLDPSALLQIEMDD